MSLNSSDFGCTTRTELQKNGKTTQITKHFYLTHDDCEVKFIIEKAFSKSTKDCNTSTCLSAFDKCFTKQENIHEEKVAESNHHDFMESSSFHLFSSDAKKQQIIEPESIEEEEEIVAKNKREVIESSTFHLFSSDAKEQNIEEPVSIEEQNES